MGILRKPNLWAQASPKTMRIVSVDAPSEVQPQVEFLVTVTIESLINASGLLWPYCHAHVEDEYGAWWFMGGLEPVAGNRLTSSNYIFTYKSDGTYTLYVELYRCTDPPACKNLVLEDKTSRSIKVVTPPPAPPPAPTPPPPTPQPMFVVSNVPGKVTTEPYKPVTINVNVANLGDASGSCEVRVLDEKDNMVAKSGTITLDLVSGRRQVSLLLHHPSPARIIGKL